MAYRESVCTDMDQVPGLVASFAASVGWATAQDGAARIVRRPVGTGAPGTATAIKVETAKGVANAINYEAVAVSRQGLAAFSPTLTEAIIRQFALARSPWLSSGQRQPLIPKPTKLHCFGAGLPEPFLAFVIEYGFNQYRSFYIGTTDGPSLGTGEVISATGGSTAGSQVHFPQGSLGWQAMFSGRDRSIASAEGLARANGGVFIAGKDDDIAAGFSRLIMPDTSSDPSIVGLAAPRRGVWGGPKDGVDDALISNGFSPFSGDVLLVPVNLFTVVGSGAEARAAPVGSVRGVRSVNMRNIEPGALLEIGNKLWRIFPHLRKNPDSVTRAGEPDAADTGTNRACFPIEDTSWFFGLAFLEGDAG